jgi:dienelactone hydrolase
MNRVILACVVLVGIAGSGAMAQDLIGDQFASLKASALAFVDAQVREDFDAAGKNFDDVMKKASPPDKMGATWKAVIGQVGPFQKVTGVRGERKGKYDIVYVTCQFKKMALDLKVVFGADTRISGYFFVAPPVPYKPPAYVHAESFHEAEVTVGGGEWAIPGTITIPKGAGPFRAVVMVQGSGPQDRDETIGPNKPFRDLAWGLASRGVAVLRYEKRTKEHAALAAKAKDLTVKEEVLDDALAGVNILRKARDIDPKKVFVLGHSLGAMAAPRLARLDPDIAGLIVMAGAARPIDEVLIEQLDYVLSLEKNMSDEERAKVEKIKKDAARLTDPKLSPEDFASGKLLGATFTYWRSLRGLQPAETAATISQPMLILQGGRDYQVTTADFELWKKALSSHRNVQLKSYPKLNHLFMEGEGKAKPAEYEKSGHVAGEVLEDIAAWVKGQ